MPHRYFCTSLAGDTALLEGDEAKHLAKVMRAKPGDEVILCDGAGTDAAARVTLATPNRVELEILERRASAAEPATRVTLYVGYPKQDKLEWIIQKGVELGAVRIVPFFSRYCVVQPKKEPEKNVRYNRIAAEAAKQSGRGILPAVELPRTFAQMLDELSEYDRALLCYEGGGEPLSHLAEKGQNIAIITGSEGGFSEEEAARAAQAGALLIGLGPRILRCETAPVAALAAVMAFTGELE